MTRASCACHFVAWEVCTAGQGTILSEVLNKLEGNCQIVRPECVSVHHISMCFRGLRLANFQQDLNDLPYVMQNFTYVQQCFTFRINKVCFPVILHYITTLHYTAHVVFRKYYFET
jgi:hypothetical protein